MSQNVAHDAIEAALADAERLRRLLKRGHAAQVRNADELGVAKATAMAWFNNHRAPVTSRLSDDDLAPIDSCYKTLVAASDKASARSTYTEVLASVKKLLIGARAAVLMPAKAAPGPTTDAAPSFATLVADPPMRAILARRWAECSSCLGASAPLAATVMMGGLLEGLLLAKVNSQTSTMVVFTAKAAPKDRKSGNTLPLSEWTLKHYIDVAHELKWISQSARDIGNVLRDYRNYVHPQKELSHSVTLSHADATLFWEVAKSIARQLL